jgi:putative methyltransferase (TIGR04325 family)
MLARAMALVRWKVKQSLQSVLRLPPIQIAERWLYERSFAAGAIGFRGVFATFAEAAASAPTTRPLGYDNPEPATMYADRPIYAEDYAVLFWLKTLAAPGWRLFDYGGHTGGVYDAFLRVLALPAGFRWTVFDVPAVVEQGRQISAARPRPHLEFTTDFAAADGSDLFLASGSLQYIDRPLHEDLRRLAARPKHLIVNQLPLHDSLDFVTLQNIGTAYCPYRIFNRRTFVSALESIGYELIDAWSNRAKSCFIPTYSEHNVEHYSGAYFRLREPAPEKRAG